MADEMRRMLDELMGKERNASFEERGRKKVHFSDPGICKNYLVQFCPNEMFVNTKSDLGPCGKEHDIYAKMKWDECANKRDYPYERDFIALLERLVDDLDRRVKRHHDRLNRNDDAPAPPLSAEVEERSKAVAERIQQLLKQVEDLGEEGRVDEAASLMKAVDALKVEQEQLIRRASGDLASYVAQEKKMTVCSSCGAFLVIGDAEKRLQSHMEGKQHMGFTLIRDTIEAYKKRQTGRDAKRRRSPEAQEAASAGHGGGPSSSRQRSAATGATAAASADYRHQQQHEQARGGDYYNDYDIRRDTGGGGRSTEQQRERDRWNDRDSGSRYGEQRGDRYGEQRGDRYGERDRYGGQRDRDYDRRGYYS